MVRERSRLAGCARGIRPLSPRPVFLRWFLKTFPAEMRAGWALVRPDLLLWLALSALISVAALAMPPAGDTPPPVLPMFVAVFCGLLTMMLPAVLFTAQSQGRQLTWGPILMLMGRKAAPLVFFALTGFLIAWGADVVMLLAVTAALGETPALIPISTAAAVVIFVSIIVRFSFLSFLVILLDRDQLPPTLWQWQRVPQLAAVFWPLTASSRLTEGNRWGLVFYTLLERALPVLAAMVPAPYTVIFSTVALVVLTTVQGVFFLHYRRRCEEMGVPPPALPIEEALTV